MLESSERDVNQKHYRIAPELARAQAFPHTNRKNDGGHAQHEQAKFFIQLTHSSIMAVVPVFNVGFAGCAPPASLRSEFSASS
jgi:hypothetical protein